MPIEVPSSELHLKSYVSAGPHNSIVIWSGDGERSLGLDTMNQIQNQLKSLKSKQPPAPSYEFCLVPDRRAANLLTIGNTVFIERRLPTSKRLLASFFASRGNKNVKFEEVENREL